MKRVLLLVLLIVSLVELTLERDKVYQLFSTAALCGTRAKAAAQSVLTASIAPSPKARP